MKMKIPLTDFAIIGGSSTFSIEFPEEIGDKSVRVLKRDLIFETPFGQSPPFKLFQVDENRVLTTKMHGWRSGVSRADASRQLFWILEKAKAKKIFAEGGVGSINKTLKPGNLAIPDDYIDFSLRRDVSISDEYLLIMRKPICQGLAQALVKATKSLFPAKKLIEQGVYLVTNGRHFESRSEISVMKSWGVDIVGQSLCPEVYLAREIGACYAGLYQVVNYAEGVLEDWSHEKLAEIFFEESRNIGQILLTALREIPQEICECQTFRKKTLLREEK